MNYFKLDIQDDGIAVVTFDRPPVNAQSKATREEAIHLFDNLSDRDDVRVVILTNSGDVFSAGADIKERADLFKEPGDYVRLNRITREFFYAVADCSKPVIAAANGPAIGAGFILMASCDIFYASRDSWFAMPELDVGLAGGARFLMELFGKSRSRAMYFSGDRYSAEELQRLGVIEACPPREALLDEAMIMAKKIAKKDPFAVQQVKRSLSFVSEMAVRDAYRHEQAITADLSETKNSKQAQATFLERRRSENS